jgi:putative NADH-flavin reductase
VAVIALFGATGRTGQLVLDRALADGHRVRALVRDPDKISVRTDALVVVVGEVLDPTAVEQTVEGANTVLSMVGQVPGSPRALQTESTRLIVSAMTQHEISRLVTLSGGGLRDEAHDRPHSADRVIRFLLKRMAGHVLADAEGHLAVLQASSLDWTVVRAPVIRDRPGTGRYRVGYVGVGTGTTISRADLADFIVTQIEDRRYIRQMPFVTA